jgi:mRNA interferase RelE/StbE
LQVEQAKDLSDIKSLKKMSEYANAYRIKIGDYRIGISIEEGNVDFCAVAHRKDIYRLFP